MELLPAGIDKLSYRCLLAHSKRRCQTYNCTCRFLMPYDFVDCPTTSTRLGGRVQGLGQATQRRLGLFQEVSTTSKQYIPWTSARHSPIASEVFHTVQGPHTAAGGSMHVAIAISALTGQYASVDVDSSATLQVCCIGEVHSSCLLPDVMFA